MSVPNGCFQVRFRSVFSNETEKENQVKNVQYFKDFGGLNITQEEIGKLERPKYKLN